MDSRLPTTTPVVIVAHVIPHEMTDAELGAEAALSAERAEASRSDAAEQALRCGELLIEARARCRSKGASFNQWLSKHWKKSRTTAYTFILVSSEVQQDSVRRAGLLKQQSVRAFLTDAGYSAGGVRKAKDGDIDLDASPEAATDERLDEMREQAEREGEDRKKRSGARGMREPGADEDEDPAPPPTAPVPEPRQHMSPEAAARKATEQAEKAKRDHEEAEERRRLAAQDRIDRQAELDALEAARNKPPGPDKPKPKPNPNPLPVGPYTVQQSMVEAIQAVRDIKRRIDVAVSDLSKVVHFVGAPYVDANGFESVDPRAEDFDAIREALGPLTKPWDNDVVERIAILLTNHGNSDAAYIQRVLADKLHTKAGQKRRGT